MAFLQKKPNVTTNAPLYTLSSSQTYLIIGLGNPAKKYAGTRHNLGFAVVDEFAQSNGFPSWAEKKSLLANLTIQSFGSKRVILVKPTTFMNDSGQAAQAILHFYKIPAQHILVAHDELAIPFGQLRTRLGGTAAGHNGIKSLINHLGPDFGRLRIGIQDEADAQKDSADFVLERFSKVENDNLSKIIAEALAMITEFIYSDGLDGETRSVL